MDFLSFKKLQYLCTSASNGYHKILNNRKHREKTTWALLGILILIKKCEDRKLGGLEKFVVAKPQDV
jgi:hypothetical protein